MPDEQQRACLLRTLEQANALCNWLSRQAWELKTFRRFDLQEAVYRQARERNGLSAQLVIRCLAKVADAYRADRQTPRTFKPRGAVAYDGRILSWYTDGRPYRSGRWADG